MRSRFATVVFMAAAFGLGLLLSPPGSPTPNQSLDLALIGKYFAEMQKMGKSGHISPSDCRMLNGEEQGKPILLNSGGCSVEIMDVTYNFSVQFTDTGSIEYSNMEVNQ